MKVTINHCIQKTILSEAIVSIIINNEYDVNIMTQIIYIVIHQCNNTHELMNFNENEISNIYNI